MSGPGSASPGQIAAEYEASEGFEPLVPPRYRRQNDDDANDDGSDD